MHGQDAVRYLQIDIGAAQRAALGRRGAKVMMILIAVAFAIAWWLGLYLIARGPRKALLLRAGLGLLAYALALACESFTISQTQVAEAVRRTQFVLTFLPALTWTGATIRLLPEPWPWRARLDRIWLLGVAPLTIVGLLLAALFSDLDSVRSLLAAVVLLPLLGAVGLVVWLRGNVRPANAVGLLAVATLFFFLGFALLVLPLGLLSPMWASLGIGFDLALLGIAVARFDAFDEGEALGRDMLRSLLTAQSAALLFGGQVGLVLFIVGLNNVLVALLFSTIAVAISIAVLSGSVQRLLDRLAFSDAPTLQQNRSDLRESAEALPRLDTTLPLADLEDAEFARLTRRALSHYGDLPKLASNPLTQLPIIDMRIKARRAADHPLERAAELKTLLVESIDRLKPRDGDFGTSDAWRHYNALYFPYVVGLRPYSRRTLHDQLDDTSRRAFDWFNAQVPERTLHNWQNAAAKLVAQDLREHYRDA